MQASDCIFSQFFLAKEDFENRSRIDGYNSYGLLVAFCKFPALTLVQINGMHFLGSVLVFKDLVMRWNVPEFKDLQPEHLALVKAISPPVGTTMVQL